MFTRLIRGLFLLLLILPTAGQSADKMTLRMDMLYRNWTTREGLPQDHVRVMTGTRDGFLWLGTDAGLARFDGVHFKTYGLHEGLGAVTVLTLHEAHDGALWIGTLGGGVSVLRDGKIVRTYGRTDGLPTPSISAIAEDSEHRIWAGSLGGLSRLENGRFAPVPGPPGQEKPTVRGLFADKEHNVWITLSNFDLIRWKDGKWQDYEPGTPASGSHFSEDRKGRLWIVDDLNLWSRDGGKWTRQNIPPLYPGSISSMNIGPDDTIWFTYYRLGIFGLRDGRATFLETRPEYFLDLAENTFVSPDGQMWVGTSTHGLYSLTPRKITVGRVGEQESNSAANFMGALAEVEPGKFIIGTQGRGFYVWKDGVATTLAQGLPLSNSAFGNVVRRLSDGTTWAGGTRGLFKYNGNSLVHVDTVPTLGEVWDLCEDRTGGFWAGQGNGLLYHLDGTKARRVDFGGAGDPIKGMVQEADGTLWIGTRGNGLFRLKDGQHQRFGMADGLFSEVIRVLYLGKSGVLWVGTAGGGLAVKNGQRFHSVTSREGLPDDVVSQITEDDTGRLWLGTNRGLAVLNPAETARLEKGDVTELHPLLLNRADGLRSEEFTIISPVHTSNKQLAFATTDGFALITPKDFQADPRTPPVFIEQVLVNGQPVQHKDGKLSLPPGTERLEIQFTGLHFGAPERLRFRNRLIGVEEEWGDASPERRVEYRNLAPGTYRFELSGTIGNGLWNPIPAELEIVLAPHFWETTWFRTLVILVTLALVAIAVRRRERLRARRKIEALKREQAVQTERARIARDLHDDVGASLTQVALLSELAQGDLTNRPERASAHINEIFTTAQDVTRALDEIVWAVNPVHDTLESFATFLGAFVHNYTRSAGLTARLDIPATLPSTALASDIRHHLYLATKEILHNVVKHAQASEIRLALAIEGTRFSITLADNGKGLASGNTPTDPGADGLPNLQKRLQQIGGTCTYHSEPGQGTRVEMIVPLAG